MPRPAGMVTNEGRGRVLAGAVRLSVRPGGCAVSLAYFDDVSDLATFCAGLALAGVRFSVEVAQTAGRYCVTIAGGQS
jgi:hypothetical protein